MRPECTEGAGGGLLVPMAWMYAEYIADDMLRTGDLMPPTTLEYRAGRDALALTIFLSDRSVPGPGVVARVEEWRTLTAYGARWRDWIRGHLARLETTTPEPGLPRDPDLALARAAWRWLEETELLAPDLNAMGTADADAFTTAEEERRQVWTPAWQLGLPLGHLAIQLF